MPTVNFYLKNPKDIKKEQLITLFFFLRKTKAV